MIKYSIFLAVVFGTSFAAYAAIAPNHTDQLNPRNTAVIY